MLLFRWFMCFYVCVMLLHISIISDSTLPGSLLLAGLRDENFRSDLAGDFAFWRKIVIFAKEDPDIDIEESWTDTNTRGVPITVRFDYPNGTSYVVVVGVRLWVWEKEHEHWESGVVPLLEIYENPKTKAVKILRV